MKVEIATLFFRYFLVFVNNQRVNIWSITVNIYPNRIILIKCFMRADNKR